MELPLPEQKQAFCNVSALEGGELNLPLDLVIANGPPGVVEIPPSLCFLIQHSANSKKFLFDLGIRRDFMNYPPSIQRILENPTYTPTVGQDCVESLAEGNLTPDDIDVVCLSHLHYDHVGDTHAFKKSTFVVGDGCRELLHKCYPEDPESMYAADLLPGDRTRYLTVALWKPIGPFPRAFDFYGDGSLYIVDSPGHLAGHVNILARTSPDGAWIFLAGDSAHHWNLITGESQMKVGGAYCMHNDMEKAAGHIANIRAAWKLPRVRVILAHDTPWYKINKGGSAFWPGKIDSL